eukprot:776360-Rhodomonas_salina.3
MSVPDIAQHTRVHGAGTLDCPPRLGSTPWCPRHPGRSAAHTSAPGIAQPMHSTIGGGGRIPPPPPRPDPVSPTPHTHPRPDSSASRVSTVSTSLRAGAPAAHTFSATSSSNRTSALPPGKPDPVSTIDASSGPRLSQRTRSHVTALTRRRRVGDHVVFLPAARATSAPATAQRMRGKPQHLRVHVHLHLSFILALLALELACHPSATDLS